MKSHLSGYSEDQRRVLEKFPIELLSQSKDCGSIIESAGFYPENTLIQIYAKMLLLYDMTHESFNSVRAFAEKLAAENLTNPHEKLWAQVLLTTTQKKFTTAIQLLEEITNQWPEDLVAFKFCEYLYFISGFKAKNQQFLAHSNKLLSTHSNNGYFLGSHAFALSLNDCYDQAIEQGNKAVDLAYTNPWAHHALAHAFLGSNNPVAGQKTMLGFQANWQESGWPALCHNTWHLMLFQLANHEYEQVQNTCFDVLWPGLLEYKLVHIDFDVISTLWRLELYGLSIPEERYQIFNSHLDGHWDNFLCGYQVAHSVFALVRAGNAQRVNDLLQRFDREKIDANSLKFLKAINRFANEEFKQAADDLEDLLEAIPQFGGSDGQIDLFYQTYYYCLLKSKQMRKAEAFKSKRPSLVDLLG